MLKLGVKQTTGTSRIHPMSQNAVSEMDLSVTSENVISALGYTPANDVEVSINTEKILELENKRTLFIDKWNRYPHTADDICYFTGSGLYFFDGIDYLSIPLSADSVYIDRYTNTQYAWNGSNMVQMTFPLTKVGVEAVLVGEISSHTHAADALKADKLITYSEKTASFTLANTDSDKWLNCNHATTAIVITVPTGLTDGKQFFIFQ